MQTQIFSNPLTAVIAVGSGDLLGHTALSSQCVAAFVACFILSSILTMIVITSIPLKTLDRFFDGLTFCVKLALHAHVRVRLNLHKLLHAGEERLLARLLRRKLLSVDNPLKPVSQQSSQQRAENSTANARPKNVVIHKSGVWPNEKS